jgi:HSP20 family protein
MTNNVEIKNVNNKEQNAAKATVRTLVPSVDIQELPELYIIRLDIPGAEKESIKAQVDERTLTIAATVAAYFKENPGLLYDDSVVSEYRREFTLAENIDTQNIEAVYDLGVLTVTLKKKQQFLPKEISIK